MEYDDIIVGAGSSGAVLAARLSEDPDRSVLLIEAGPHYQVGQLPDDLVSTWMSAGPHDWGLVAKATAVREIPYPRGKVTGGCSAINGHIALRGAPEDFDEWAAWGNHGWSFEQVLPYYRKLERDNDIHDDFHGSDGPIWIERPAAADWQPLNSAFYDACVALGYAEVADHNHPRSTGIGPWPRNRRAGVRISTAIGYLAPAEHRLNLTIRPKCHVHRVLIENGRAVGIEAECGGELQRLCARRVTLSAGAISSPVILMRSGVGDAGELAAFGIKCVADLPGVGRNLIDHVLVSIFAEPATFSHDPQVTNPVGIRYTAGDSAEFNDMQLYLSGLFAHGLAPGYQALPVPSLRMAPGLQRPRSRGRITLRGADPKLPPMIDLNYLDDSEDVRRMVEGVRIAWRLMHKPEMARYIAAVTNVDERMIASDSALAEFIKVNCGTIYHPVGTAKMGPESDPMAVVDEDGRVRGVPGLRIADASIMPNIVRANTNLTCIMIGERIADRMNAAE